MGEITTEMILGLAGKVGNAEIQVPDFLQVHLIGVENWDEWGKLMLQIYLNKDPWCGTKGLTMTIWNHNFTKSLGEQIHKRAIYMEPWELNP